jgi:hypothetical protein
MSDDKIKRRSREPAPIPITIVHDEVVTHTKADFDSIRDRLADSPLAPLPTLQTSRRKRDSATKCIYFNSASDLDRLERLAGRFAGASVSKLMSQLAVQFLAQAEQQIPGGSDNRCVDLKGFKVYL